MSKAYFSLNDERICEFPLAISRLGFGVLYLETVFYIAVSTRSSTHEIIFSVNTPEAPIVVSLPYVQVNNTPHMKFRYERSFVDTFLKNEFHFFFWKKIVYFHANVETKNILSPKNKNLARISRYYDQF